MGLVWFCSWSLTIFSSVGSLIPRTASSLHSELYALWSTTFPSRYQAPPRHPGRVSVAQEPRKSQMFHWPCLITSPPPHHHCGPRPEKRLVSIQILYHIWVMPLFTEFRTFYYAALQGDWPLSRRLLSKHCIYSPRLLYLLINNKKAKSWTTDQLWISDLEPMCLFSSRNLGKAQTITKHSPSSGGILQN